MTDRGQLIRENFHTLTPYIIMHDAARAIEFYKLAFGAIELTRIEEPETGRIRHAEIKIGSSPLMLVDESPRFPEMRSPQSLRGSPVQIYLYVDDVDALVSRAIAAGAKLISEIKDASEGERRGGLEDPFGLTWWIATYTGKVSK